MQRYIFTFENLFNAQQYKKSIYIYKQTVHFDFARCVLYRKNTFEEKFCNFNENDTCAAVNK